MAGELQGAAQGAAIGTSIMPGWGTAIGAVAGALLGGSSTAQGGSMSSGGGASAQPQSAQAAAFGSGLDGSGWNVIIGNGSSGSVDNRQTKPIDARGAGPVATATPTAGRGAAGYDPYLSSDGYASGMFGDAGLFSAVPMWVWLVFTGAVLWKVSRSKK